MQRPNIVVFFTDQQRWDTLGLNGNPMGLTPNLDRLASQGTFVANAVTCHPVCAPARSSLQTGQYPSHNGVWCNGPALAQDSVTLAKCFNEAGYRTGYIGKWHLAGHLEAPGAVAPEYRAGYQDWLGGNLVEMTSGPYSGVLWNEAEEPVRLPGYRVDGFTDAAIRYLADRAKEPEQPFMLFLSYLEPHHQNTDDSYPAPPGYAQRYSGGWMPPDLLALGGSAHRQWPGYCGMVKRLDEALGRIDDALHSLGMDENTIVVFISDHGCHFRTRNGEYKRSPHESSVRVPMAFWGPGFNGGGQITEAAGLINLAPTLLDAAGIAIPKTMQADSLAGLLGGQGQRRETAAAWPEEAFIQFGDEGVRTGRALRTNRWKYAVSIPEGAAPSRHSEVYVETHLYDLRSDPYELDNLIGLESHSKVREHFRRRLAAWLEKAGEPAASIVEVSSTRPAGQRTVEYPRV